MLNTCILVNLPLEYVLLIFYILKIYILTTNEHFCLFNVNTFNPIIVNTTSSFDIYSSLCLPISIISYLCTITSLQSLRFILIYLQKIYGLIDP